MGKKWGFFFAFLVLFLGGSMAKPSVKSKAKLANDVRAKTIEKLRDEIGLIPIGFGAQMMEMIEKLELSFECPFPIDQEGGRWLLLKATEEFLSQINANKKIRTHLIHIPFKARDLIVRILGRNKNTIEGGLSSISSQDGIFAYQFTSPDGFSKIERETYEEALQHWPLK